jgi:hypothetical protein
MVTSLNVDTALLQEAIELIIPMLTDLVSNPYRKHSLTNW